MSLFSNFANDNNIKDDQDIVGGTGGFAPLDSNIYDLNITAAFLTQSQGGAWALNLHADTAGKTYRETIYFTNRNGENFFTKDGERSYLPGYNLVSALALLTCNEAFQALENRFEEKVIQLYDPKEKKEMPTKVNMVMPMVGKTVKAAILRKTENKKVKDDSGNYVPEFKDGVAVTRDTNSIEKFLHSDTRTVTEIKSNVAEPVFAPKWLETWEGNVKDATDKNAQANAGSAGMPNQQASGAAPATGKLFG
jgi:hypothetical protein